jgi:uncharacterized protein (TIGR02246 family)
VSTRTVNRLIAAAMLGACAPADRPMEFAALQDLASRYTAAWGSQDAASVAAFFAKDGTLQINDGTPAVGRAAITAAAQGFMTALPDMALFMDSVKIVGTGAEYFWTLTGTNTGPGGTGNAVWVSGYEQWTFTRDGLIAQSLGHFPSAEYERQLRGEAPAGGSGASATP